MRPVDLAREHGLSTQAVRNYEEAGILPRADRTASGYYLQARRNRSPRLGRVGSTVVSVP